MTVRMGVDPERIKQAKPQPKGWYKLKLVKFAPKKALKDPSSVNLNGTFEILNSAGPEYVKTIKDTMSLKMEKNLNDIVHGLGFPLEKNGDVPATKWVNDPADPDNVEKWQYQGPLMGRTMEAELDIRTYNGNEFNRIRQVRCAIPDCHVKFPDIKHQTNMIGKG